MTSPRELRSPELFVEFREDEIEQTIAQRFEKQARRYPDRIALQCDGRSLTYEGLNRTANRLAHAIVKRRGAQHEAVAVLGRSAAALAVAFFGVLKSGKVFVPIDPKFPAAKSRQILEQIEARLVVSDPGNAETARRIAGDLISVIDVDEIDSFATDNLDLTISPDAIAFINFTSGSTGEPKGVVWNHRNELHGIRVKTNTLGIAPTDRVSLLRANNVGAGRDMLLALLNGAAAVSTELSDAGLVSLGPWLRAEAITVFSCVATIFRHALQDASAPGGFPSVRLVHVGGEPVFRSDVELYKQHFSDDCRFICRYSISETTPVSYFFIDKQTVMNDERVPVGYAAEGNEVLILDDNGDPVASNTIGEIAVKSPNLALGYWQRPELTAAEFLADPSGGSARIYRTGDLGYRLPDGCLVHVGRKDLQTKIRGHRVEMPAVETALHAIPAVKQAVVLMSDDAQKRGQLVAFVVPKARNKLTNAKLRAQLKLRLPDYMVPSVFMFLKKFPTTSGSKVDRQALAQLSKTKRAGTLARLKPRNSVEQALCTIWRDQLEVGDLGVDEDFTELGGDSLSSARVVTAINDLFPLRVSLSSVFEVPTIKRLAEFIRAHETASGQSEKIASAFLKVEAMSAAEVAAALAKD